MATREDLIDTSIVSDCACTATTDTSVCPGVSCADECPPTFRIPICGSRRLVFKFGECGYCLAGCCDAFFKRSDVICIESAPRGDCTPSGNSPIIQHVSFNADTGDLYFLLAAQESLTIGERFVVKAWAIMPDKSRVPLKMYVVIASA